MDTRGTRAAGWTLGRVIAVAGACQIALMAVSCGPAVGSLCATATAACEDPHHALECRNGVWAKLDCLGIGGCQNISRNITCDYSGNAAGDQCPLTQNGTGVCSPDGRYTLECRDGIIQVTNTCPKSCTVESGLIQCQ